MRLEAAAGMDVLRKLWRARKLLVVVLVPLVLVPLPVIYNTSEANCAFVLLVTAAYWVSEAVPLAAAALVPAFLYPLFGIMKSSEVAAEYCKDTTMLLIGVMCLATSIEKWNLHKRIALRMVMIAGAKPGMLVLGFMGCTTFLSMWLSNTSTTAMVMPIAEAVLQQLIATAVTDSNSDSETTEAPEDDLHSAHSDKEEIMDKNQLELFYHNSDCANQDLSSPMETREANGLPPVSNQELIGPTNGHLPQARNAEAAIDIPKQEKECSDSMYPTKKDHMICKCLSLSITYASTIGGLITITGTSTNLIFAEQFASRYPDAKGINFGSWFIFSLPIAIIMLFLTWLWLHFLFLGYNFKETCSFSKKRKSKREMLSENRILEEYEKLGPISYPEVVTGILFILMTVLWFTRNPGFVPGWVSLFQTTGYRTDATVAVFVGFLLFVIPAKPPFSRSSSSSSSNPSDDDPLAPLITWKEFQKLMPWGIVILVGGGFALAAGCKVSGLSVLIGKQLEPLSGLPPLAITLLGCLLVSAITELVSNPATITVFLPILSTLSETLHINPIQTLIPATICVSLAVMIPVGNPPNAIVFSYNHIEIGDMVKAGTGVKLIGVAAVMLAIATWGVPLFDLNEFPDWALVGNVTGTV